MRAYESWVRLDNQNHEQIGAAMVKCQNPYGACFELGECVYGNCFGQEDHRELRRVRKEAAELGYKLVKDA